MTTVSLDSPPNFSSSSFGERDRKIYEDFTSRAECTRAYAKGASLTHLVDLAKKVSQILVDYNPVQNMFFLQNTDSNAVLTFSLTKEDVQATQWHLRQLATINTVLIEAIDAKKEYYNTTLWGQVTKWFLTQIGTWNEGNTAAILAAEDFLLFWDPYNPRMRDPKDESHTKYLRRENFFPWIRTSKVDGLLNGSTFPHPTYAPSRGILQTGVITCGDRLQ